MKCSTTLIRLDMKCILHRFRRISGNSASRFRGIWLSVFWAGLDCWYWRSEADRRGMAFSCLLSRWHWLRRRVRMHLRGALMNTRGIADFTQVELNKYVQQLGNTPMEAIYLVIEGMTRKIHLKLESENPTGSVKDRTGFGLIQALEAQNLLSQGSLVVESTSGNLGVALTSLCRIKGYTFIAVIDPKTTQENLAKMQAYGAHIEMVHQPDENGGYLLSL